MKKFVAKIEVWLDDSEEAVAANGFVNTFRRPKGLSDDNGPELFSQIHLPPNKEGNNPTTLAHELGHVVAHIYRTPASLGDDLAMKLASLFFGTPDAIQQYKDGMRLKLNAEKEAWEIAHKIYPDIDPAGERASIDGYTKAVERAPLSLKG